MRQPYPASAGRSRLDLDHAIAKDDGSALEDPALHEIERQIGLEAVEQARAFREHGRVDCDDVLVDQARRRRQWGERARAARQDDVGAVTGLQGRKLRRQVAVDHLTIRRGLE